MSFDTFFATLTSTRSVIPDADNPTLYNGGDANFDDSKNYQWSGPELTSIVGEALPIVYGRHKVAGNVINAYVESGEQDTLNILIALCEGPIQGVSNVKLNGTPIEQFYGDDADDPYGENAEVTFKKGETNQTLIQEFGDIHSVYDVGQTLLQNEELIYTSASLEMMAFLLEIQVDRLYQLDENLNKISWYYAVKVEFRPTGTTDWTLAGIFEVNKNSDTVIRRFIKSDYLAPDQYDIRVTKLSDNSDDSNTFGTMKVINIDEIINLELQYPYVSLLGVRLVATDKISNQMPNITAEVEGTLVHVPDVRYIGEPIDWEDYYYDPSTNQFKRLDNNAVCTWNGTSYVQAYSANPAWCLRDLMTNSRYGLGQFVSPPYLNEASFLESALYCDEGVENIYGKKEKRTRLDIVIDKTYGAPDIINQIASTFRGLLSNSNGVISLVIERASDYTQIFNMGNIIAGTFGMRYHSSKEIPNVLVMEYTNKDKDYARDSLEVSDEPSILAGNPIRQERISSFGCTRSSQLLREGKILLNKIKENTRSISFKAFTDALTCQVGDIVLFQHDTPLWSFGGRVQSGSTTTKIKLDRAVVLEPAKSYKVSIRSNVDDTIEERNISNLSGTYSEVNLALALSFTPAYNDLWVVGETANFGMEYRIIGITRDADGVSGISAVQYTASVFDNSSIEISDDNFSYISLDIPDVYDLNCQEQVTRENDGTIRDTVLITFRRPPDSLRWVKKAVRFHIYYTDTIGRPNWIYAGSTELESFTVTDPLAIGGTYTFAVVSESESGDKNAPSTSPQDTVSIGGWTVKPADVTGFYYTFVGNITFTWDKNQDPDLWGYEIRTDNVDWGQDDPQLIWRGNAEKYTLTNPTARQGITYYIKAYNTSYNFSENSVGISPVNLAPISPHLSFTNLFQKAFLLWGNVPDSDISHYEVWRNDNDNWIGIEQGNEERVGDVVGTSSVQVIPYEETYFRIRGVDSLGTGEWSNTIIANQIHLASDDLGDDIIGAEHLRANSVTALSILAGSIQAGHIATKAVIAQHIDVEELSALSAHLGSIESGLIVGAVIKTSNFDYRTEINQTGLFAYDSAGRLRTKLVRGELCLVDPTNSEFYSYLDSGALKFHTPYGTVPYVKRLLSGFAETGQTVFLAQWYEQPQVTLGINKLSSFKSANVESDQEWCVYHDNVRQYNNGGGDFGWAFDVHSKLVVSGGTTVESLWLCNFDQVVYTNPNTCQLLVKNMFQLWTHACAPANYCYGVECYEVRYRECGSGVWCSCEYLYTQPHSSVDLMKCTQIMCNTMDFGLGREWELSTHRLTLNWYDSGIPSGTTICCACCFQYTVDCSYWYWQNFSQLLCAPSIGLNYIVRFTAPPYSQTQTTYFPAPSGGDIYCSQVTASVYAYTWYEWTCVYWTGGVIASNERDYNGGVRIDSTSYIPSVTTGQWVGQNSRSNARAVMCYLNNIKQLVCFRCCLKCCDLRCCWCCYQYEEYLGDPETCTYERLYSTQDTTASECVLDGAGLINYLAVAYA